MKIKFAFPVHQVDSHTVEVGTSADGQPLVDIDLHPCVQEKITDKAMDELYETATKLVVKETIEIIA